MPLRRSERNKKSLKVEDENDLDIETPSKKKLKIQKKKKENVKKNEPTDNEESQNDESVYAFTAKDIHGEEVSMEKYKGHVCIIVNVASKCGHTKSNYEQFVELYEKFSKEKGLKILAFPCNQFGSQEPGDSKKIIDFVKKRNVNFDIFEKINVNGANAHPLWKHMKEKIAGPKGNNIDWNFTKFIIDKEGNVVERHKPTVKPLQLIKSLEKLW